jgi:hypothetical protein
MFDIGPHAGLSLRPDRSSSRSSARRDSGGRTSRSSTTRALGSSSSRGAGIGIGGGFFGVELSGYSQLAFPFDGGDMFTINGAQLALLFGDFYGPDHVVRRRAPPPPRYYWWHHPRRY